MGSTRIKPIQAVPTNIITGFLGAGKTSTILHLLKSKPEAERWAILVNEFGEIGIDGALLQGQSVKESGVSIREVPGGCMCCAAGVPMRVALNQLLSKAHPDRLLIEPTGLGHPAEVLKVLSAQQSQGTLSVQKVITLVDARQLSDNRYTEHETFKQQIAIADVIVGNKQELYQSSDYHQLEQYVRKHGLPRAIITTTQQGAIEMACLEGVSGAANAESAPDLHHHDQHEKPSVIVPADTKGYVQAINRGEGFASVGWRFTADQVFCRAKLLAVLRNLPAERIKGVFNTDEGAFSYNIVGESITQAPLQNCPDSRIEVISRKISDEWGRQLLACVI
ncbi:MAG: GTP-binding protein [Pseudomonadota bacterium]